MDEPHADYADTPAAQVQVHCVTCDGDGWVLVNSAAVIAGRMASVMKHETCPTCTESGPGVRSGRVNLATGPGAHRLRRVDRVAFPWDGWD